MIIADRNDARQMVDIAQQIGIPRGTMKYWFWEECRELVLKRRLAEDRRILRKYQREHQALRAVVQSIYAQKLNASNWQVEQSLRKQHLTLIRPDIFTALKWMRLS